MKQIKKHKSLLLILMLIFPSSLLIGFIPMTVAQEDIPVQINDHRWHWDSDITVGTLLMFEEETSIAMLNGTVMFRYKILKTYNITDIINTTRDGTWYYGSDYYGNASLILGAECYYNCTSFETIQYNMTEIYGEETPSVIPLSMFGYNNTSGFEGEHYAGLFRSIAPFFLPINESDIGPNIPFMAQTMNKSFIDPYAQKGYVNRFDQDFSTTSKLSLYNSTDNYYLNATYYNNGTIENMDASYLMYMGGNESEKEMAHITTKFTRVFDKNIIDEVVWDDEVQVGNSLYYGFNEIRNWDGNSTIPYNITYEEIKVDIIEISNITTPIMTFNTMFFQCFQQVLVNMSLWNSTLEEYIPTDDGPIIFGMANELLPINLAPFFEEELKLGNLTTANITILTVNSDFNITVAAHPDNQTWNDGIMEMQMPDGSPDGRYYKIEEIQERGGNLDIRVEDWDNPPSLTDYSPGDNFSIYERAGYNGGGPKILALPKNLNPEDFEVLFFDSMLKQMGMEEIFISSDGLTVFNNSINQKEMRQKYNLETGLLEWMYMTMDDGDISMVAFRKNMTITTGTGYQSLELYSNLDGLGNATVSIEYNADDDIELYWAVLPINPILVNFNSQLETMPLYLDLYVNDSNSIHDVNLTIIYDSSKLGTFDESDLGVYGFTFETEYWGLAPEESTINDPNADTLKIYLPEGILSSENMTYFALGAGSEWNWGVEEGDILMYLLRGFLDNGTKIIPFNDFSIANITSIYMDMVDIMGPQLYSIMNATKLDPDGSGGFTPSPMGAYEIGMFGINETASPRFRLGMNLQYSLGIPTIIPLQWGNLNLTAVGQALYTSFYSVVGSMMGLPNWDIIQADEGQNNLYFGNSTNGFYMNLTYFDNGTIKEYDVYSTFNFGSGIATIDISGKAQFDTDTTSEVVWGVNVGDVLYFGDIHKKQKVQITSVDIDLLNLLDLGLNWYDTFMNFSVVNATISKWDNNTSSWVIMNGTETIAVSNDYFLFSLTNEYPLLIPTGATGADVYDCFSPFMGMMGLDGYIEIGTDYLLLDSSYSGAFLEWYFNSTTGVTKLLVGEILFNSSTDLDFFVIYLMENASIAPGTYNYTAKNPKLPGYSVDINLETSGGQVDLLYTIIEVNPSATISQEGDVLFYSNIFVTNCINIDSLLVKYTFNNSSYSLSDFTKFHIYRLEVDPDDKDDNGEWIEITIEELKDFDLIITSSSISFNLTTLMKDQGNTYFDLIISITYEDDEEEEKIPGYNVLFLLALISLFSVVTAFYKRRKKLLE